MQSIEDLKNRIFSKKTAKETPLTSILMMVREFNCIGEIIGREFEVYDRDGECKYVVRQKPMKLSQLNKLLTEFETIKKIDHENEKSKFNMSGKGNKGKR